MGSPTLESGGMTRYQVYRGESLIQQFDDDAQEQIRNYLDELHGVIERVLKLLTRVAGANSIPQSVVIIKYHFG